MKNWDTVDAEVVCSQLGFLASGMLGKNLVQLLWYFFCLYDYIAVNLCINVVVVVCKYIIFI